MTTMTPYWLSTFIAGDPKPQPRPRAFSRNGSARVYDPATAEGWKSLIAEAVRGKMPPSPLVGSVDLRMTFFLRRPRSHFRKSGALSKSAPAFHVQKPDLDNLAKSVLDALTMLGMWGDDAQIDQLTVAKSWSDGGPGMSLDVRGTVGAPTATIRALGCTEIKSTNKEAG